MKWSVSPPVRYLVGAIITSLGLIQIILARQSSLEGLPMPLVFLGVICFLAAVFFLNGLLDSRFGLKRP